VEPNFVLAEHTTVDRRGSDVERGVLLDAESATTTKEHNEDITQYMEN
jgi:hypothetical protein